MQRVHRLLTSAKRRRRVMGAVWLGALGVFGVFATDVGARPVPTGRFVEIPFGVSVQHPSRTGGVDAQRSWRTDARLPERAPTELWRARVGLGRATTPAIAQDGTAFFGTVSGLSALTSEGAVRWALPLGVVNATPSLRPDGSVAVALGHGQLVFVGAGGAGSRVPLAGASWGSPLVLDDGSVVVGSGTILQRVDADGRSMFRVSLSENLTGTAALSGEFVVVPVGASLHWVGLSGQPRRVVELGANIAAGPSINRDGEAWVLTHDGQLIRVTESGRIAVRTVLDGVRGSPATNLAIAPDGSVRFGTLTTGLLNVSADGVERWRFERPDAQISGPVVVDADGHALTVEPGGDLIAVGADGSLRWAIPLEARVDVAPAVAADGTIYVSFVQGEVHAFR